MRYAILGDIHANYTALQMVVQQAREFAVQYWVLGDLVGYGPAYEVGRCLQWLRLQGRKNLHWLPGNHDEWIVAGKESFSKEAMVSLCSQRLWLQRPEWKREWIWFASRVKKMIQDRERSVVLKHFPDSRRVQLDLFFTHASLDPLNERRMYLYPWKPQFLRIQVQRLREKSSAPRRCLIHGHTHYPVYYTCSPEGQSGFKSIRYGQPLPLVEGYTIICPGSVGQPRDGDPRASYVIIDTKEFTVTYYRVEYDVKPVAKKLREEHADFLHQQDVIRCLQGHVKLPFSEGQPPHERVYESYEELARAAYERLISRLLTGDGGSNEQEYRQVYRRPQYDLESRDDWNTSKNDW